PHKKKVWKVESLPSDPLVVETHRHPPSSRSPHPRTQSGTAAEAFGDPLTNPMEHDLVPLPPRRDLARAGFAQLPAAIERAGERAVWRFLEFFTANIRNKNTRAAYAY